jgi:hypothetical protein
MRAGTSAASSAVAHTASLTNLMLGNRGGLVTAAPLVHAATTIAGATSLPRADSQVDRAADHYLDHRCVHHTIQSAPTPQTDSLSPP